MTSAIVARRYARALFAVAKEEGRPEAFNQVLQEIVGFLKDNPDVEAALTSPVFPADLKQAVVAQIIKACGVEGVLVSFLGLLVERRRIQHLRLIGESFQTFLDEDINVARAVVRTAVPMPEDLAKKFSEVLAQMTGKNVVLEVREDPDIIGGVVAHIGDTVLDGSIRNQLQGFK